MPRFFHPRLNLQLDDGGDVYSCLTKDSIINIISHSTTIILQGIMG